MASLTLPSGRVLEVREVTYGDVCDAQDAAAASQGRLNAYIQCLEPAVTGLTLDEIRGLTPADGMALESWILDSARGRPKEQEAPFENPSPSS